MADPVFQDAVPEISPFVEPDQFGTGTETEDSFISVRAGLMQATSDSLKNLAVAQQNVSRLDRPRLKSYIDGLVGKTLEGLTVSSIDYHAENLDVDGGVSDIQKLRAIPQGETEVERLAHAATKYLDQFEEYSIPREVARRQYTLMLFAKKLEEAGIVPDTLWKKTKGITSQFLPGRAAAQFATSSIDYSGTVEKLQQLNDEEFFNALPKVMTDVLKMSGDNPFYFLDRMQSFLDPEDVKTIRAYLALDVVDAASTLLMAPKLIKLLQFARATNTPIKIVRDSGQLAKAAEINVASAGDEAAATTAKTVPADAAQSISPFGGEGIDPSINDRIAAESQALIAERVAEVTKTLAPLHDDNFLLRRTAYTEQEIEDANKKYLGQFAGSAKIVEQGTDGFIAEVSIQQPNIWPNAKTIEDKLIELQNTKRAYKDSLASAPKSTGQHAYIEEMIDQTRDEIARFERILERTPKDRPPAPVEVRRVRVGYRNNDFGQLEAIEYDKALRHVTSPSTTVEQLQNGVVEDATLYDFDTARIVDVFFRARNAAIRGLNKRAKKDLDSILLEGDKGQVVYTDMELVNGVRTPDGLIKLDTTEKLGAYRAIRETFDVLYQLKNKELARQLELGGFKALHLDIEGNKVMNFANPNKIIPVTDLAGIKRIYNTNTGMVEGAGRLRDNPESIINQEIYELKYPLEVGEEQVNYVVASRNRLKELPKIVLNRRDGYVPKIDKNVFYVAEMIGDKLVDGNIVKNYRTVVRYFDNPKDADAWSSGQRAKGQLVEVRAGREWLDLAPGRREQFEANIFGGLYGGKRGERPIPFNLEGTEAERLGGIESMEAYMNHIASRMPAVDFRASLIQRFLNSAHNPLTGETYLTNPGDWRSPLITTIDHKQYSGLKAMQDWVSDQVRIPTTEERVWGNLSQKLAELTSRVPGSAGRKLSKWSMQVGANDAFTQLRGLSFHATLGWFNTSQFMVQAMGASLAMSLHPEKIPLLLPRSLALRAAMFASSEDVMRMTAKAAFMKEDDFLKMVRAYQKTGLHESTLSTGDFAALQGLPQGLESLRWVANKGLVFFKEGERWARNYAWIQAYDEITKSGKLALTDRMIDDVTKLHLKYTLNLNRANRAFWQKGVLSIPTQFYQISTKFIENMLPNILVNTPNGWSGKQKAFILLGQMALFGAAGIPYGKTMYNSLANWAQSKDDYGLAVNDPAKLTAIQGGLTELMMYAWTGERLDVTNRLSIPAGIETLVEVLASEQSTMADKIFGVSGEIGSRVFEAIRANYRILASVVKDPNTIDATVLSDVLDQAGKVASSYRNLRKAQLWSALHYIEDRYHNKIIPVDDVDNRALLFAQSLGVAPKVLDDYYTIKHFNKITEQDYRDAANAVLTVSNKYYGDADILVNEKKQKRMEAEIAIVLLGLTDAEKRKVMEQVNQKMQDNDYKLPEEIEKALDNLYNKQGASDLESVATMIDEDK